MKYFFSLLLVMIVNPVFAASDASLQPVSVSIPGDKGGIGFDDLVFSKEWREVLVPAGQTGKLYLIDPVTFKMKTIGGFSSSAEPGRGHEAGITSADEGDDVIFTADHGKKEILAVRAGVITAQAALSGDADYVRYVKANHEVWVTEPHDKRIEVFQFTANGHARLTSQRFITFLAGPESLTIDQRRKCAYTNAGSNTVSIDLRSYTVRDSWPNACVKSRGNALDERRGFLFVSCKEGSVHVFDVHHTPKEISNLTIDPGPDVIDYNSRLSHLYVTSSSEASLSIIDVSSKGKISLKTKAEADKRSHCVVGDDQNNIWVCDPPRGRLLRYKDS